MTLRARLFLIFGGLVAVIVVGQWLLVGALTTSLSEKVDAVAVAVGRDLLSDSSDFRVLRLSTGELPLATERMGKRVAVLEMEDADGTTWVQEVLRLEADSGDGDSQVDLLGGLNATAVFTYQLKIDGPGERSALRIQGPEGGQLIPLPAVGVHKAVEETSQRLFIGTAVILVVGLVIAGLVAHRVTAPLRGLAATARTVGAGQFGALAPEQGSGEVRDAILSFNKMSTHLKELDDTARRLRAREHLFELGEIARGLAHSLRNPLNALGLSLEALAAQAPDDARADELAQGARRQIRRVDGAVRSFLALASEGGGQVSQVDLHKLVQDVALEASQDAASHVRLEVKAPAESLSINGVEAELRAVVQALVVNAVEASPQGGRVEVTLAGQKDGAGARLEIADDGPGLPAEVRARLFTPHVTTKANGAGMGLYLAQRIASSRYGGRISLEDRASGGTLAVLTLDSREERQDG
ncbi:MAG: HAMP domain-containing sensor histidine kinase [Acidobacteria bacterium]|nr:HAMP domain-containing sensor histidine kinase [Acidobacteriota bacterium]